jgi:two-component system nitrate/nitrite response regulator NarL
MRSPTVSSEITATEQGRALGVLLLDDQSLTREGVEALLGRETDIEVLGGVARLAEALASERDPDVIVAEPVLPGCRRSEVLRTLRERFPSAAILMLTAASTPADVYGALAEGANGYLLKDADASELVTAVRRVAEGQQHLGPEMIALLGRTHPKADLTPRELEVANSSSTAISTTRSPRSCTSRCEPSSIIARTSSASSASMAEPSSSGGWRSVPLRRSAILPGCGGRIRSDQGSWLPSLGHRVVSAHVPGMDRTDTGCIVADERRPALDDDDARAYRSPPTLGHHVIAPGFGPRNRVRGPRRSRNRPWCRRFDPGEGRV